MNEFIAFSSIESIGSVSRFGSFLLVVDWPSTWETTMIAWKQNTKGSSPGIPIEKRKLIKC